MLCYTLPDLLTSEQCRRFIESAENQGYLAMAGDYPPSYRDNDRIVLDDPDLAAHLFRRLKEQLPRRLQRGGQTWYLEGLNPRFRGCRYSGGQSFTRHRDGAHSEPGRRRSFLTLMLYLNDHREFQGGHTRFYQDRWTPNSDFTVAPEAGTGIVFSHDYWHDGQAVTNGTKYVLRTDVMYRCGSETEPAGHGGYVWDIVELPEGRLASGSRDKTVLIWNGEKPEQVLRGHEASVTCLQTLGRDLWSGGRDRHIFVWSPDSEGKYNLLRTLSPHPGAVLCLRSLRDGRMASACAEGTLRLWSREGEPLKEFPMAPWPWALIQEPEGSLISAHDDGRVVRLCPRSGKSRTLHHLAAGATALLRTRDGTLLVGSRDGELHRWQQSGHPLPTLRAHRGPVTTLAELPDGRLLSGAEDDGVLVWNEGVAEELVRHDDFVRAVCPLSWGPVASASYDGSIRLSSVLPANRPQAMARTERAAKPGGAISAPQAALS